MASNLRKVLDEALRLPADERAEVAGKLLQSLEDEEAEDLAEVEAAWSEEIVRRMNELETGAVKGLTRAEARQIVASDRPKSAR